MWRKTAHSEGTQASKENTSYRAQGNEGISYDDALWWSVRTMTVIKIDKTFGRGAEEWVRGMKGELVGQRWGTE